MTKFKEDDIVKCIDNTDVPSLVLGMNYRVRGCGHMYVELSVDYLDEYSNFIPSKFNTDRFELTHEKATYVWPSRHRYEFDEDDPNIDRMIYEELKLRLERAEELLEDSIVEIEWWVDEHMCCRGKSDKFLEEVDKFLKAK